MGKSNILKKTGLQLTNQKTKSPKGNLKIVDNRTTQSESRAILQQSKIPVGKNKILQKVKLSDFPNRQTKYKLVRKTISENARISYIGVDNLLKNVTKENMSVILEWTDEYIKSRPWNMEVIDILSDPMSTIKYDLTRASSRLAIGEREYGSGARIAFTGMSSCLGIIGKLSDTKIIGIHLGLFNQNKTFSKKEFNKVANKVKSATETYLVGEIGIWKAVLDKDYNRFMAKIKNPTEKKDGSGNYSARITDGNIRFWDGSTEIF